MGINIGIIGLGLLGKRRFEIFRDMSEVQSVVFYDSSIKSFQSVRSLVDVDLIFSDDNIDAVIICSPNAPKMDLIVKAFKFKKHIFCEKPLEISKSGKILLDELHKSNPNIKLKFGFNHRYLSHYRVVKEMIESNRYGKPLWIRGVYGKGFDETFFQGWRSNKSLSGGGILFDQGIHMLDLVLDLIGDLDVKNALIDDLDNLEGIDANAFINLRSHSGIPVSIHSSMYQWEHKFCLDVGTENAIIGMKGLASSTKSYGSEISIVARNWDNNFVEVLSTQHLNPDFYTFKDECGDFIDSIIGNKAITDGTLKDTIRVMDLINRIYLHRQ